MNDHYRDLFVSASDGLRLYTRDYGPDLGEALPVVCLPGLARTSEDFHDLALHLSQNPSRPRRVLALDYRGRGRSEWDKDWHNYDVRIEANDVLQVLTAAGIRKAAFVGTSRGGLITMALGALHPTVLAAAVLNDVGPQIEGKGLIRIRGYVGKLPVPRTLAEGADLLKRMADSHFPRLTAEQWLKQASGTWREDNGRLVLRYDPQLMKSLEALDLEMPLPDLWPLFDGLKSIPILAIRGANSDLLSAKTLQAMQERHPRLKAITVPDQGHAPALEGDLIDAIEGFVTDAEAALSVPA
ncbi:alpha/beta fold hydrolase [Microvirga puerhi]|uniref:Alpha/beta hydrolase n=1 Tax=Microvirga puerhi TaxID=2876078 RepID=A0ABS7VRZ4_9HYPH|nr:alpha/beta hydrolase [Microvirga puerhi]MBZ6077926.1 alpha/beta hydrolase [Microvirga puerhi]